MFQQMKDVLHPEEFKRRHIKYACRKKNLLLTNFNLTSHENENYFTKNATVLSCIVLSE